MGLPAVQFIFNEQLFTTDCLICSCVYAIWKHFYRVCDFCDAIRRARYCCTSCLSVCPRRWRTL